MRSAVQVWLPRPDETGQEYDKILIGTAMSSKNRKLIIFLVPTLIVVLLAVAGSTLKKHQNKNEDGSRKPPSLHNEIEFGNYKIELPDGWIEQPKSSSETPEGLCYPPLACLLREREIGSACLYACVQQGNNNYSLITLTDTFESQIPGGWAPSVEEMVMIENKDKEWPFLFVWEGEYIDEENMDPEKGFKKRFDENQNPYIWYIAGCLEKDLCFNYDFNAGSGDSQTYVNYFKEFINGLNIIKN